jgi:hypothetical protein
LGEGQGGKCLPPVFFNLGIVYLVIELNNGKKIDKKRKFFVLWDKFSPPSNLAHL